MNAFRSAGRTKIASDLKLGTLLQVITAARNLSCRNECGHDVIVTVHTDNFLSDILVRFHINTVSRNIDRKRIAVKLRREIKACKDAYDIFVRNGYSQYSVNLLYADSKFSGLDRIARIDIESSLGDLAAAQFLNEMQSSLHCHDGRIFVNTL